MLLLLLLLQSGETTYLTNLFQKEIWFVTFGLDALKKLLILFCYLKMTWAFERPLFQSPQKGENSKAFLDCGVRNKWKDNLPATARSQSSSFSSTPLHAAPKGIFSTFELWAHGPLLYSSQRVKHEFQRKIITLTSSFIYQFNFCKWG